MTDGVPFYEFTNEYDFLQTDGSVGSIPEYNCVIVDGLKRDALVRRLGSPDRSISCPGSEVVVYNDPGRLFNAFLAGQWRPYQRQLNHKGRTVVPGAAYASRVGRFDGLARVVSGGPAGLLAFGVYMDLRPGDYTFRVDYLATPDDSRGAGAPNTWDVVAARGAASLARGSLPPAGPGGEHEIRIHIPPEVRDAEFRMFYGGSGSLRFSALTISR
jgi:hypothetical protein